MDDQLFKYGELRGEFLKGDYNQSADERKIMEGSIYPDNYLCNWNTFYKVINYCNEIITYAPKVKENDNTFSDYILYGYLSEAYFLRSLSYFYLVRIFMDVPFVTEPTLTDGTDVYPEKVSGEVILENIKNDLITARNWATVDGYLTIDENKGRATKAAIDALIADIALWMFDYETCIEHVDNIQNSRKYILLESKDWFNIFSEGNTYEGIFEFQFEDFLNQKNSLYGLTNENSHNYDPSVFAVDILDDEENPELVRGVGKTIKRYNEGSYIIWKYVGIKGDGYQFRPGTVQNSANWIIYRYADVLLMKAEALSQLGRYDEAREILIKIRTRAGISKPLDVSNSPAAFEDKILDERAIELAYEGKRWFDLMRMGRRNNFSRKNKLIEIMVRNVPSTQKRILQTKLTNPLSWYLPISKEELERNKNLVQNPYYNF
jgi:tetratricopeptide (TPR) repeat protein